jgi:hypothetical protein
LSLAFLFAGFLHETIIAHVGPEVPPFP